MSPATLVRARDWWSYKLPPLLAAAYVLAYLGAVPFRIGAPALALLLVFLTGTASFGYFVNDLCDIASDRLAGKRNEVAEAPIRVRVYAMVVIAALVAAPWYWLPRSSATLVLVGLELALLVAYAAPPLRLKARGPAALFADALYAHTVPMLIVISTFSALGPTPVRSQLPEWAIGLVGAWSFLVGFRGILLHQIDDLAGDQRAGIKTSVTAANLVRAVSLVVFVSIPLELAAFVALAGLLSIELPYLAPYLAVAFGLLLARVIREHRRRAREEPARERWRLSDDLGVHAALEPGSEGGVCVTTRLERTGEAWQLRLRTHPVRVPAGDRHRLYVRARSDRARPLELAVTQTTEPWAALGPYETVTLGAQWQRLVIEIPAAPRDTQACVQINLGSGNGPVELTDVALLRVGDSNDLLADDQASVGDEHDRVRAYARRRAADLLGAWLLNDLYEKWLPLFPLLALALADPGYWLVAVAHVALFRSALPRL